MIEVVDYTAPQLPEDKVRYLMGVGKPNDIIEAVYRGVDIFDCVIPTREGRHGIAYVGSSSINIKNSKFESDLTPLDESSDYLEINSKLFWYCSSPLFNLYSKNEFKKTSKSLNEILFWFSNDEKPKLDNEQKPLIFPI